MKKGLFIAHRIPFPPNKGDKLRAYHILKFLAKRYEMSLLCHIDEERDLAIVDKIDIPLRTFRYHFRPKGLRKLLSLKALPKGSLSVAYFYAGELQARYDQIIAREKPFFVFCSCAPAAEYVFRGKETPGYLFLDFMDVDSEKWRLYAEKKAFPSSLIYRLEASRMRAYEKRILKRFDHVFLVSEAEAHLFREKVAESEKICVLENGVDLCFFSPDYQSKLSIEGPVVVFTGAMDYWPNADAVIWFVEKCWPLIRQRISQASFFIVGKDPLPEVKDLAKVPGVEITGFVPDTRDYLALADVCVAPLRLARGIQNKVLEAMAMAKATVVTPQAAEGIKYTDEELLVASSPEDFAEKVIFLLKNPEVSRKIGKMARKRIEKEYSWEKKLEKLKSLLP
ncbi:TIGR03087 family PEP-CTERM/XrtA system glycosyltransferase [Thermodesulfatator atlanticus]|uniref:TIGR03087 family PEP-CTERM/XrtA system glycosyltransferase n=1 Tax=Thermodesulfatator atlanticus TaxID=501497 RepID=UPI000428729E|nr:TIGR03087 family PEP-CTERM/XrtA system glycosyltransferase [Thermodesulfatator atlanticus]